MAKDEQEPRNGGSRPVPDPTVLTTQAVDKAIESERVRSDALIEVIRERLNGIDKATDLRLQVIDHIPARIDEKLARLEDLMIEKFESIDRQFAERDVRADKIEGLQKTALDAAFAAQKEAAAEQNKSNTLAISKSETATTETINKNAELFRTESKALSDKIEDLKSRVGVTEAGMVGIISTSQGGSNATAESRASAANQRQILTVGISAVLLIITVIGFVLALQAKP